ncbi:MAG: FUSC family protein [Microbacterium sp.]|jgi:hypothetical protein|nr:FUSC family protein [Microbacterium sp.]
MPWQPVFFLLQPRARDRTAEVRVTVSIAIPVLALVLLGQTHMIIYAAFGAFTALYGRGSRSCVRLHAQLAAAALIVIGAGTGVLLAATAAPFVCVLVVETAYAAVGSLWADRASLNPRGPFFGIFALGACASVAPSGPPLYAAAIAAGTATLALAVTSIDAYMRRARDPRDASDMPVRLAPFGHGARHAIEYALVVFAAGVAGYLLGWGHSYWAMASAAVPLAAADLPGRIGRGLHRIVGTLVGLVVTAAILVWAPPPGLLAIIVIALMPPTEALMSRHYAAALVFFTPMILVMTQLASPVPRSQLIIDRAAETALGAVIGMLVVCAISGAEALLRRSMARARE